MTANRLSLDISLRNDGFDTLESTYRDEGLSVGADHMRLFGEDVQLEVSFHDLVMGKTIGHGACSSVNIARNRRSNETYAVKLFNIYDRAQASQLFNEILLLTSFSCDALISLKGAFHDQGSIGVILEYMDRGSLEFLIQPQIRLSDDVMAAITFQILWGLGYLHHEKQIHRDIKPGNALMNSQGQVKLSDFGISKSLDHTTAMSNSAVGSYMYMSPERLNGDKYDASADVWSVGVSVIQMWTKKYPFQRVAQTPVHLCGELETFDVNRFARSPLCGEMSNPMKTFVLETMAKDPQQRSSCMSLVFECSWFSGNGLSSLELSHERVARWLRDLDRQRQQQSAAAHLHHSHNSSSSNNSHHPHQPTQQQRKAAAAIVRDVMENSMSMDMSQSFSRFNSYVAQGGGDAMEVSMDQSQSYRRPNPFMSSGSLTSSQILSISQGGGMGSAGGAGGSLSQQSHSADQQHSSRNNGSNSGGRTSSTHYPQHHPTIDEDYPDDFEDEVVETYEPSTKIPPKSNANASTQRRQQQTSGSVPPARASEKWRSNNPSNAGAKSIESKVIPDSKLAVDNTRPISGTHRKK